MLRTFEDANTFGQCSRAQLPTVRSELVLRNLIFPDSLPSPRYRLLLYDGQMTVSFVLLASHLNPLVQGNQLLLFTVIQVKKHTWKQEEDKRMVVIILDDLEVIAQGDQVGVKLGQPASICSDGKTTDWVEAKLAALR